ncbi:helix-turn-helix domain-containing protein [Novosphingobium sp. 9U]|uniref:winged helix-turn-helix transcriptional regulator n=1 Tax=Novosphingobium sp. 9U TaxID=2653158 RepID=UPI0012F31769|nr:helix-turn-helix domain-containing protein [Novosphingobium sp. 9U]VWX52322.1 Transcriptional regulator [Novosphingobium sp. 9U]
MRSQKETAVGRKLHGKWYDDACGAVFAMELIGERWSLPVIRELMLGGRRFSDMRASLPGISAKVLTERLESLEAAGIVTRLTLGAPAPAKLYALTPWGLALEPTMQALGRWSVQSPEHNPQLPLTPVSLMLSLRTMLDPAAARDVEATIRFEVGAEHFDAQLTAGELHIARASPERAGADLVFRAAEANAYLWVFYGKQRLGAPGMTLALEGDRLLAERFIGCFRLPAKQPPPPRSQA